MAAYAIALFRRGADEARLRFWTRATLLAALAIHTTLIYAETAHFGHCLVYSPFELMTMVAFTVTLTYLIVELTTGERGTGLFFLGIALLFQIASEMVGPPEAQIVGTPLLEDAVGLHVSAALFGLTAFTMSAVWGGLYLMQHHRIKANRFGLLYERLPSLGLMERMSAVAVIVGLIFFSIAIAIAAFWLPNVVPGYYSTLDPKIVVTALTWLLYAVAIALKFGGRLDQRRFILLTLCGFGAMLLSLTIVNLLFTGFHDFQ